MARYKIVKEDWFDHEDTTVGYYESLEAAQADLRAIREECADKREPKDKYYLYEVPEDGHDPQSYAQWHGID